MKTLLCLLLAFLTLPAHATPLTAAQILVCPGPLYPAKCATALYAPTTSAYTAASVSKTAPQWAHTFGGYTDSALLIVCPVGANLSTDSSACTNAAGTDASVLMPKSAIAAPVPLPTTQTVVISSVDNPQFTMTYQGAAVPACFTVNAAKVCVP